MMACQGVTKSGERCQAPGGVGGWCWFHDPGRGVERAAARRLGGRQSKAARGVSVAEWPADVRDLRGVLDLLNTAMHDAAALDNSVSRGRLVVAIAGGMVAALQAGELEQRLAAVEAALKAVRDGAKS